MEPKQSKQKKVVIMKSSENKGEVNNSHLKSNKNNHEKIALKTHQLHKKSQKKHSQSDTIEDILRRKQSLKNQLAKVQEKEKQFKRSSTPQLPKNKFSKTKYFRSEITEKEKDQISKILKETKEYEKSLETKAQSRLDKIAKLEQNQKKELLKLKKQRQENKKKEIQKNLQVIEQRKTQRTKSLNKLNKNYQQVARKTFLYQTIQDKWKIIAEQTQDQRQTFLQKNREDKKFHFDEILKHQRKYSQILNKYKDEKQVKMMKFQEQMIDLGRSSVYPRSTFFQVIEEEQQERKREKQEKLKQSQFYSLQKNEYSDTIRQKNSKLKLKQKQLPISPSVEIRKSKSFNEIKKLGNDNMKQIHSNIAQISLQKSQMSPKQLQQKPKYKNYLKSSSERKSIENPEAKRKIFSKYDSEEMKMYKAKLHLQQLNNKEVKSCQGLINNISAKLALIEQLGDNIN